MTSYFLSKLFEDGKPHTRSEIIQLWKKTEDYWGSDLAWQGELTKRLKRGITERIGKGIYQNVPFMPDLFIRVEDVDSDNLSLNRAFEANKFAVTVRNLGKFYNPRLFFKELRVEIEPFGSEDLGGYWPEGDGFLGDCPIKKFYKKCQAYDGYKYSNTVKELMVLCEKGYIEGAKRVSWAPPPPEDKADET